MTVAFEKELESFLKRHPEMSIVPSNYEGTIIEGEFFFSATYLQDKQINDSFRLKIEIPKFFPKEIPRVTEIGGKIPRHIDFHVFSDDDTLCLGSPLRLRKCLNEFPTIQGFIEKCLVPYLYSMSLHIKTGEAFIFSELSHGIKGLLDDYKDMFHVETNEQAILILELLTLKKRESNKRGCPCGCGRRVGKCKFKERLDLFRSITTRDVFKEELKRIRNGDAKAKCSIRES